MRRDAWRTVRVFISSTFRDMQAERDHLVRFVFPRLREELLKRRIHLVDVDLRWGVTSEQDALEVCREIIDECRPRFICILGGRYGWVPSGKEHSITADEVRYGMLDRPGVKEYRYFYFRDPGATGSIPEEAAREHGYFEADAANVQKLADLKQEVRDAGFEPFVYDARWDPESQRLVGLEAFGNRVYADLLASVDDEFGTDEPEALDEFAEEDAAMEAFIQERVERYVVGSRQSVFDELTHFAETDGEPNVFALTGPSGCGKSALLGKFSQDYARDNPDHLVITHFVAASAGSTDVRRTLRRLCHALAQAAGDEREIPQEVKELLLGFAELLGQVAQSRRVVLILDALNQLDATDNAHTMYWLPRDLPPNVRVIVSSLEHPTLEAVRQRGESVHEISLKPLTTRDSEQIIEEFLHRYRKRMNEGQVAALLEKRESVNPLYLLVALEELRTLGGYEEITQRIEELPDEAQPLFLWIMRRLEADAGFRDADGRPIGPELVRQFVSCLGVSRHGLSQTELAEIIAPGDPQAGPRIRDDAQGNVAALIRLLQPYLMHRGELLDFYHTQLREAVEGECLDEEQQQLAAHRRLADHFRRKADPAGDSTWTGAYRRGLSELPYHEIQARMWPELEGTFTSFAFVQAVHVAQLRHALAATCDLAGPTGVSPVAQLARELASFLRASWLASASDPDALGPDLHNWAETGATARMAEQWAARPAAAARLWLRRVNRPSSARRLIERATLTGHANSVVSVAFAADGRTLLSASCDGTARLWDVASGACTQTLAGRMNLIACAADANLERALCTYWNGELLLWDVATGARLWEGRADGRWPDVLPLVSPSGRMFGWGESSGSLWLGTCADPLRLRELALPSAPVAAAFEGERVLWIVTRDGSMFRISLEEQSLAGPIARLKGRIAAMVADPEAESVWVWLVQDASSTRKLALYPGSAELRCVDRRGRTLHRHAGMPASVHCLSVHLGKALAVTGDASGEISVWGSLRGRVELLSRFAAHATDVLSVHAHGPSKVIASGGFDWTVRLWDLEQVIRVGASGAGPVIALAIGGRGGVVVGSDHERVCVWEATTNTPRSVSLKPDHMTSLASCPGSDLLVCGHWSGAISTLSARDLKVVGLKRKHRTPVGHLLHLSGTGLAASVDWPYSAAEFADGLARLVKFRMASLRERVLESSVPGLPQPTPRPRPEERCRVAVWQVDPLRFLGWLPRESDPVASVADLGDGSLALGGADGIVSLWDCRQRSCLGEIPLGDGPVAAMAWQADAAVLWAAVGRTVCAIRFPPRSSLPLVWEMEALPLDLVAWADSCVVALGDPERQPGFIPLTSAEVLRPCRLDLESRTPALRFEGAKQGLMALAGPLERKGAGPLFAGAGHDPRGKLWIWQWDHTHPVAELALAGGESLVQVKGGDIAVGDSSGEVCLLCLEGIQS